MKTENKKILVILAIVVAIISILVALAVAESKKSEKLYNQFEEAFTKEEATLIYMGRETCSYCQLQKPSLKEMKERYDFDYIDIDIEKINSNYLNKIMEKLKLEEIGTPYLAVITKDGVVDKTNGYVDYDVLFEFLQKNKIIAESAELLLNYIDYAQYEELIKSKENTVIVVGQSTCRYCVEAKLELNKVAEEHDIEINYLNLSYLKQEEGTKLEASLDYFKTSGWGTPVTLVVKEGKVVDTLEGYTTKDNFVKFFKEQGVL